MSRFPVPRPRPTPDERGERIPVPRPNPGSTPATNPRNRYPRPQVPVMDANGRIMGARPSFAASPWHAPEAEQIGQASMPEWVPPWMQGGPLDQGRSPVWGAPRGGGPGGPQQFPTMPAGSFPQPYPMPPKYGGGYMGAPHPAIMPDGWRQPPPFGFNPWVGAGIGTGANPFQAYGMADVMYPYMR